MDAFFLVIFAGIGSLFCLIPLALYCLYLSHLNSRPKPTLISGSWDFVALLLGLSGFIVVLGPMLLSMLDSTFRHRGGQGWAGYRDLGLKDGMIWSMIIAGYFILLSTGIWAILKHRRPFTAIYNVETRLIAMHLTDLLDHKGFAWRNVDNTIEILGRKGENASDPIIPLANGTVSIRLVRFPVSKHVNAIWSGNWSGLRESIESELPEQLALSGSVENSMAGWMFTAALTIIVIVLSWLAFLIYLIVRG